MYDWFESALRTLTIITYVMRKAKVPCSNMLNMKHYNNIDLFCNFSMFCCTLHCAHSSFAIILMGKRELVALLGLSCWCLVIVVWLFLVVPWICLQFMIVVFPDHTHLLYFNYHLIIVSIAYPPLKCRCWGIICRCQSKYWSKIVSEKYKQI